MTLELLLNTERLNRLMVQNTVDNSKMSLRYVLNGLISNSFKKTHEDTYLTEIQHIINTNILVYLLNLSEDKNVFMQVKYESFMAIKYIKRLIARSKKLNNYYDQYSYIIDDFKKRPELYKIQKTLTIPDGSPIGNESCSQN
jgi:predicted methyltransferase